MKEGDEALMGQTGAGTGPVCGDPEHRHAGVPCSFYAQDLPKVSALDLLGIAPDFTGPGTTDQYVAHHRHRCESDCPYCAEDQRNEARAVLDDFTG